MIILNNYFHYNNNIINYNYNIITTVIIINCYKYIYSEKSGNDNSCARVDAILIRRKDSKSHVKGNNIIICNLIFCRAHDFVIIR